MTVDQLPGRMREFANYLDGLLARLDQGAGWCAVFWQRDPDGMQACIDGREIPPWDVMEALLQDLAADYGPEFAAPEKEQARSLHAAALNAHDARPGARDALGDRLDVMLREQRYAAERQAELGRLLASAPTREQADALRLDLAWARDDHERATARCTELRSRIAELDDRSVGAPAQTIHRGGGQRAYGEAAGAGARGAQSDGSDGAGAGPRGAYGTGARAGQQGVYGSDAVAGAQDAHDPGAGAPTRGAYGEAAGAGAQGAYGEGAGAGQRGAYGRDAGAPARGAYGEATGAGRGDAHVEGEGAGTRGTYGSGAGAGARGAHGEVARDAHGDAAGSGTHRAYGEAAEARRRGAYGGGSGARDDVFAQYGGSPGASAQSSPRRMPQQRTTHSADPAYGPQDPGGRLGPDPGLGPEPGLLPEPGPVPEPGYESGPVQHVNPAQGHVRHPGGPASQEVDPGSQQPAPKQRKRRRGGARFAGMVEEEAVPVVVPPEAVVPVLPEPPAAGGRTPRGARFAGAAEAVPEAQAEQPVDVEARREVAGTVGTLARLRGEGRSGEAHALLVEAAYWPAARIPLLAAEMQRAGLGADWATLLWEAASLPADRLVAAADALVAAGRTADGEQILRQGVARPAVEIGQAVLGLAGEGRRREIRALLDAYVRVRTPEEAARSVEPDPGHLVPLLLEAARGVSEERHWDLVHALRVAGFAA
ncbi:hypothetical protein AB0L99_10275 [Streptomyces sp. NPDC051954]|uniref:hypothetical protein n=1 Tax=Streptomyces sp. NPDC051954 TaxID=3155524 RepID=UPI0034130223